MAGHLRARAATEETAVDGAGRAAAEGGPTDGRDGPATSRPGLVEQLREDLVANCGLGRSGGPASSAELAFRALTRPGFHAVAVHRFGSWLSDSTPAPQPALEVLYRLAFVFVRNVYGIELPRQAKVGRRLRLPHQGGIVVHDSVEMGDDCLILHNVTVGDKFSNPDFEGERTRLGRTPVPVLGSRVRVGAGAVVVGPVTIGDDAVIGANAVVTTDIPAGATALAQPPRIRPPAEPSPARSEAAD
ncbi:MAG: serine acetyltransferase [Actinomycetota bacterium]|nr:serine acetyltransferase [Actinomycetota bacterium]